MPNTSLTAEQVESYRKDGFVRPSLLEPSRSRAQPEQSPSFALGFRRRSGMRGSAQRGLNAAGAQRSGGSARAQLSGAHRSRAEGGGGARRW